jgi:6,7-dimethyl-8-ribityllumazine synthase
VIVRMVENIVDVRLGDRLSSTGRRWWCIHDCALIQVEGNDMDQKITSKNMKIAFVQANWHADIVDQSRVGFVDEITARGVNPKNIKIFKVPGVFEIPLLAKRLAKSKNYDAIVAAGFVVDGGIYRHDFVSASVINGLMQVQLETEIPVLSVVLTPHQYQESQAHDDFFLGHMSAKGREAAQALVEMMGEDGYWR